MTNIKMRDFLMDLYAPLNLNKAFLSYPEHKIKRDEFAATGFCSWRKRIIQGEVHDENAYATGGFSGHAGLFGDARSVYSITKMLLDHWRGKRSDFFEPDTVREFFRVQKIVQDSTWALGWDTPSDDGSSSGRYFSKQSVGHSGFTGVSIWMDLQRAIIVILLTNRIHPSRDNQKIRSFRPIIHDLIMYPLVQ